MATAAAAEAKTGDCPDGSEARFAYNREVAETGQISVDASGNVNQDFKYKIQHKYPLDEFYADRRRLHIEGGTNAKEVATRSKEVPTRPGAVYTLNVTRVRYNSIEKDDSSWSTPGGNSNNRRELWGGRRGRSSGSAKRYECDPNCFCVDIGGCTRSKRGVLGLLHYTPNWACI